MTINCECGHDVTFHSIASRAYDGGVHCGDCPCKIDRDAVYESAIATRDKQLAERDATIAIGTGNIVAQAEHIKEARALLLWCDPYLLDASGEVRAEDENDSVYIAAKRLIQLKAGANKDKLDGELVNRISALLADGEE